MRFMISRHVLNRFAFIANAICEGFIPISEVSVTKY